MQNRLSIYVDPYKDTQERGNEIKSVIIKIMELNYIPFCRPLGTDNLLPVPVTYYNEHQSEKISQADIKENNLLRKWA